MASFKEKKAELSIVIPAFNEERRISSALKEIEGCNKKLKDVNILEVIIVNDGSTDNTSNIINLHTQSLPIKEIQLKENMGKGAALREGIKEASGNFILTCDADGATPFLEIEKLFYALVEEKSDIVIGSRTLGKKPTYIRLHRKILSYLYRILYLPIIPNIMDASCGFKLYKKQAAKKIFGLQKFNDFSHDVEILYLANQNNYKISEVPVQWKSIPGSKVHLFKDSLLMFFGILTIYFNKTKKNE